MARMSIIAADASRMPRERSSTFSDFCAGLAATTSRGRRRAESVAAPNSSIPTNSGIDTLALPSNVSGPMAMAPTTPDIRLSFEFASTSSVSLRTTSGTSADFDTAYVFCMTSAANTSGYRNRSSTWNIISR